MSLFDIVKSLLFEPSQQLQQKSVSGGIFGFFNPSLLPMMGEKEPIRAYHTWVYAAANVIAKRVADIELKYQAKTSDGWQDINCLINLSKGRQSRLFLAPAR